MIGSTEAPFTAPPRSGALFAALWVIVILSLATTMGLVFGYFYDLDRNNQAAVTRVQGTCDLAAAKVEGELDDLRRDLDSLRGSLPASLAEGPVAARLSKDLAAHGGVWGEGIALANGSSILAYRSESGVTIARSPVDPRSAWYQAAMGDKSGWTIPEGGDAFPDDSAVYSEPLGRKGAAKPAGVGFLVYPLQDNLARLTSRLDLGATGFAFAMAGDGTLIYHPEAHLVRIHQTIWQRAKRQHSKVLLAYARAATAGRRTLFYYVNQRTGQPSWIVCSPIRAARWAMGLVFNKADIVSHQEIERQQLAHIYVAATVFIVSLAALALGAHDGSRSKLWWVVAIASLTMVVDVGLIWRLAMEANPISDDASVKVFDATGLQSFTRQIRIADRTGQAPAPTFIPTGIFLEALSFKTDYDVSVSGYVWQRFAPDQDPARLGGVLFPSGVGMKISRVSQVPARNSTLVTWSFEGTLRQKFDYRRYPLDSKVVKIQLASRQLDRNVVLVPALDSYDLLLPETLPGIEKSAVVPGWTLNSSFFSFENESFNTNFGERDFINQHDTKDLFFNVVMKRNFLGPFVSNFLVILVTNFIMFAIMISTQKNDKAKDFFSPLSGLFFTILLAHSRMRQSLGSSDVVYVEYFYFILYAGIFLVSLNTLLYAYGARHRLIAYQNNQIPRMLFWPFVTGSALAITLAFFP